MLYPILIILLALFQISLSLNVKAPVKTKYSINVCQNKNCVKQHCSKNGSATRPLQDILNDLLPPEKRDEVEVSSSGCISQCGKGPNVEIVSKTIQQEKTLFGNREKTIENARLFNGIDSTDMASKLLEAGIGITPPMMLVAACSVLSSAEKSSLPLEKEALLSSIISTLSNSEEYSDSHVLGTALMYRSEVRLSMQPSGTNGALEDSRRATVIVPTSEKAWRVRAQAEEIFGNKDLAIASLEKLSDVNPKFKTKINNEISRLRP
mmetsp:Transcript_5224/g.5965  ORF Transcript_5224/g.5965 Transcript_5224/m.5965 type:complete len:265 (-) Transcript_5224:347-1141(-)